MPKFYTSVILLINQSKEIWEKQFSVFDSRGGQNSPSMHIPLLVNWIHACTFPYRNNIFPNSLFVTEHVLKSSTSCLPIRSRQTVQTQIRLPVCRSSLIRVFPVCYSDKHIVNFSPENQYFENRKRKVWNFRKFTIHCFFRCEASV